jgi:hypothetical protein
LPCGESSDSGGMGLGSVSTVMAALSARIHLL